MGLTSIEGEREVTLTNPCYRTVLQNFMDLLTHVIRMFYQFHKPSKLVHDSSKPTLHVAHLKFMIVDLHFMNVRNQFPQFSTPSGSRILNFLPPHFAFFIISFHNTRLWVRVFVLGLTIESIWKELCVPIYNSLVLYQGYNSLVC